MRKVKDKFHYNVLTFSKTHLRSHYSQIYLKNRRWHLILNRYTNFRHPPLKCAAMLKICVKPPRLTVSSLLPTFMVLCSFRSRPSWPCIWTNTRNVTGCFSAQQLSTTNSVDLLMLHLRWWSLHRVMKLSISTLPFWKGRELMFYTNLFSRIHVSILITYV